MLTVFFIMLLGIATGYFLRKKTHAKKITGKLITLFILLLLFFLGIGVGRNKTVIAQLLDIGLQACIITAGALAGSILLSWIVYYKFFRK